jgi:phosphohistidine phosphatase
MDLYLLRHGIAQDFAKSDADRELTFEGKQIVRAVMTAISKMGLHRPSVLVNSPLIRAEQTADIAHELFCPSAMRQSSDALRSESDIVRTVTLIQALSASHHTVMLVGHDPHLSILASSLVAGTQRPVIEMQKSMVAHIELTNLEVPRMHGVLRMLLPPTISEL